MDIFLYIALPLLVATVTMYILDLSMPVEEDASGPNRSSKDKPRKEHAASNIVDERSAVIQRETARRDERTRPSRVKDEDAAPFELPDDFDIREFRSDRE